MTIKGTKFRHLTIALQLFAGIGLLTASYVTTEQGWTTQLLQAAIHSSQPANQNTLESLKTGHSC